MKRGALKNSTESKQKTYPQKRQKLNNDVGADSALVQRNGLIASNQPKRLEFIVAGAGVAGLTASLALLLTGHNVTVVDKRLTCDLKQRVLLKKGLLGKFSALSEQFNIKLKTIGDDNHNMVITTLGDFKEFQFSLLRGIYNRKWFRHKEKIIGISGKLTFKTNEEYEIIEIEPTSNKLKLKNGESLLFDHIIDATGKRRHIIKLLSLNSDRYKLKYLKDLPQPRHAENAVLCFNIADHIIINEIFVSSRKSQQTYSNGFYNSLQENGWDSKYTPIYYFSASQEAHEVYILTEIPKRLLSNPDVNLLFKFILVILNEHGTFYNQSVTFRDIQISLQSTFEIAMEVAEQPYVELVNHALVVPIGDALSPPNFHYGHGIEKAIDDGNNLYRVFKDTQPDIERLINRLKAVRCSILKYENIYQNSLGNMNPENTVVPSQSNTMVISRTTQTKKELNAVTRDYNIIQNINSLFLSAYQRMPAFPSILSGFNVSRPGL